MRLGFLFLIHSLAAFRVTRLITDDTIFTKPRRLIALNKQGQWRKYGNGIVCGWCSGWWLAAISTAGLWWLRGGLPLPVVWAFGVSAVIGIVDTAVDALERSGKDPSQKTADIVATGDDR